MPRNPSPQGWLLPSARQCLSVLALCGLGYIFWQEVAAYRVRSLLWDPVATPTDLIRAASAWSEQGASAVPTLVEALSDRNPQTRRYAVMGLSQLGNTARPAFPALRAALRDEHPFVRRESAGALSILEAGSVSSAEAVAELLADRDPTVQHEAVASLCRWGKLAIPIAAAHLTDSAPVARRLALGVLSNVVVDPLVVARFADPLTTDPAADVQSVAIQIVVGAHAATEDQLVGWLSHEDQGLRLLAIRALALDVAPREAIFPLVACIESGPRIEAVQLLRQFGCDAGEAVPVLLRTLETAPLFEVPELLKTLHSSGCHAGILANRAQSIATRFEGPAAATALVILKSIDPEAARRELEQKIGRLRVGDVPTIRAICQTLWNLPPEDASASLPDAERLLAIENRDVRDAALQVIRSVGAERSAPALARLLESRSGSDSAYLLAEAIEAIGAPAREVVGQPLLRHIQSSARPDGARRRLMRTAARIGVDSRDFMQILFRALEERSSELREGALEALGCLGGGDERVLVAFQRALESNEPALRFTAAEHILDAVGPRPEVIEALIPLLHDQEHRNRAVAAITLSRFGGDASSALTSLREALGESDNDLPINRYSIAVATKPIPRTVHALVPEFNESFSVARVIQAAIRQIDSQRELSAR